MRDFSYAFLLLFLSRLLAFGQDAQHLAGVPAGTLQGLVKDHTGIALPGVSVVVEGTTQGTTTDASGSYQLRLTAGQTYKIRLTYVGFEPQLRTLTLPTDHGLALHLTLQSTQQVLQQVEVLGRKETTYRTKATFLGSKSETAIKDLPQSVAYASKELIADQGLMRVGEVVKNFSGVTQFTFYDDIVIRGFRVNGQSNTQLLNGLRTSTGFWKQPLANYLERVEVLKGPSSALFGNASPGGVLNRVTKKPLAESRKSLSFSLGSFQNFRALADFTGPMSKDSTLLYRLNLGYEDAQSFRDLQFDRNIVIAPSFSFLPSPRTRLNLDIVYNSSNSRLDRGQTTQKNDLYSTPTSLSLATGNDYLNEQTYNVTGSLSHQFTPTLTGNVAYIKTGYSEDLYEHRNANTYAQNAAGQDLDIKVAMQVFGRKRRRYIDNLSAFLNYDLEAGPVNHRLVLGYDYASETLPAGASQLTAGGYRNAANTAAIATYVPANRTRYLLDASGNPVTNVPHFDLTDVLGSQRMQDDSKLFFAPRSFDPTYYHLHAVYAQDQLRLGRFQALLGLRYERYTDFVGYKTAQETQVNQHAFLPRAGLVFTLNEHVNFYGTYVQGYTPQTASTISNPNAGGPFDPLTSSMVEAGAKSSWLQDRLSITAAVYRIEQKNVLYNANLASQPDLLRQVGAEQSKGLEFDVLGQLMLNWSVTASYAYNEASITDSPVASEVGLQKPNAPRHLANFWTRYTLDRGALRGLGFGFGSNLATVRSLSLNTAQTIPGYTLLNAAVYYRTGHVTMQLNVNNLADRTYWVGGYDYIRLFPGAPRNFLLTLGYSL
jgi:iron complex outermembrane receptor protein